MQNTAYATYQVMWFSKCFFFRWLLVDICKQFILFDRLDISATVRHFVKCMATQSLATSQVLPSLLENRSVSSNFVCSTSGLPDSAIWQSDVSFFCVCPLIDDKLRHNIVKVAVEITSRKQERKLWSHHSQDSIVKAVRSLQIDRSEIGVWPSLSWGVIHAWPAVKNASADPEKPVELN